MSFSTLQQRSYCGNIYNKGYVAGYIFCNIGCIAGFFLQQSFCCRFFFATEVLLQYFCNRADVAKACLSCSRRSPLWFAMPLLLQDEVKWHVVGKGNNGLCASVRDSAWIKVIQQLRGWRNSSRDQPTEHQRFPLNMFMSVNILC